MRYPALHRTNASVARWISCWCFAITLHGTGIAQLDIPVPIQLTGTAAEDRQIRGLADPMTTDAAVSADASRSTAMDYTVLTGSASMTGTLTPALTSYPAGFLITVVPTVTNQATATLDLNGLGPRLIVKNGDQALDSADLRPGIPVRLIYDGTYFQLLNRTYLNCPSGFSAVNGSYCVSDQPLAVNSFYGAISACAAMNARLCSINEWAYACRSMPGFLGTVIAAEWVDDAANNTDGAKLLGALNDGENDVPGTGCTYGGQSSPYNLFHARCCATR
ncbi:MAG TPA: hypothetical protein PLB89_15790 [Flavobacteriales bacterium]|nr:hypothetical protein [Flavobacteriales bacterium]